MVHNQNHPPGQKHEQNKVRTDHRHHNRPHRILTSDNPHTATAIAFEITDVITCQTTTNPSHETTEPHQPDPTNHPDANP